jgi:predicted Zn-dependent protease
LEDVDIVQERLLKMIVQTGARSRFFFLSAIVLSAILFLALGGCAPPRSLLLADAAVHLKAGEIDAARLDYQIILERHPYDADALQGMTEIARKGTDVAEYVSYCRRLLQVRPWDRSANLAVGKELLEKGDLKDAAVRFAMAYLDSDFAQDKNEVVSLLEQTRINEQQRIQSKQEKLNDQSKPADLPR